MDDEKPPAAAPPAGAGEATAAQSAPAAPPSPPATPGAAPPSPPRPAPPVADPTGDPSAVSAATPPPVTDPPVADPPVADPPVADPPVADPPVAADLDAALPAPTTGPVSSPVPTIPGTEPALVDPPAEGDALPAELDVTAYVGQYTFPDIRRRRWPGYVYLLVATACFVLWATRGDGAVLVNGGMLGAALALLAIGAYHLAAAWPLSVKDGEALMAAAREIGFPVGHASAQLGWRGLRSRPTWRILLYSNEDPPRRRGLVLVDGVDGAVLDHFVEDNPEDWAQFET